MGNLKQQQYVVGISFYFINLKKTQMLHIKTPTYYSILANDDTH